MQCWHIYVKYPEQIIHYKNTSKIHSVLLFFNPLLLLLFKTGENYFHLVQTMDTQLHQHHHNVRWKRTFFAD